MSEETQPRNNEKPQRPPVPDDAVTSAGSSMAAWFLRENIEKDRPLKIPKLGVILYPDGREEKIVDQNAT